MDWLAKDRPHVTPKFDVSLMHKQREHVDLRSVVKACKRDFVKSSLLQDSCDFFWKNWCRSLRLHLNVILERLGKNVAVICDVLTINPLLGIEGSWTYVEYCFIDERHKVLLSPVANQDDSLTSQYSFK